MFLEQIIQAAVQKAQKNAVLPAFDLPQDYLERPQDDQHGDWTSTIALKAASKAKMTPRVLAQCIVDALPADERIARVEVAGPGFINFYLCPAAHNHIIEEIRAAGKNYGRSTQGNNQRIQVEFVSANPTGPLHIGHGRWAAIGDSLANVLDFCGYDVEREYYVNDHGSQMDVFGCSVQKRYEQLVSCMKQTKKSPEMAAILLKDDRLRYLEAIDNDDVGDESREAFGKETSAAQSLRSNVADEKSLAQIAPYMCDFLQALGENAYGGDYVIDIAQTFVGRYQDIVAHMDKDVQETFFKEKAYKAQLASIQQTCEKARCSFDVWASERALYEIQASGKNKVEEAFDELDEQKLLYATPDGATWFKTTQFGDDKDRVLIKTNGEYTYFASDVAYTKDKYSRADHIINILGADHHGYIKRIQAASEAMGHPGEYEVLLGQFVNLLRDGKPVRMSKRRGTMVDFQELLDEVGADATRYILISRSSNQPIDFDISLALQQDSSNPVYYVQYAHARICSLLRRAAGVEEDKAKALGIEEVAGRAVGDDVDIALLTSEEERAVVRILQQFSHIVEGCALDRAPVRITHYCESLAAQFHKFYTVCQILPNERNALERNLSKARLALCDAVRITLENALRLIGVDAPCSM